MTETKVKVILCDIEGTTTSIRFVKDVLFPYAKLYTKDFLKNTWHEPTTKQIVASLLQLPQYEDFQRTNAYHKSTEANAEIVSQFVNELIDKDLKLAPLKTLQGKVWAKGYENGSITGHVYEDVPAAFERWFEADISIAIYSSGSVEAQQLLFNRTVFGSLKHFICAYFDTSIGHKQNSQSYTEIAKKLDVECGDVLFLTDIVKEAEAARSAGMKTVILSRPENSALTDDEKAAFTIVNNFNELRL